MTLSPGPPPWPIPPSWTLTPPPTARKPRASTGRTVALLTPDGGTASIPGVAVDVRAGAAPVPGFAGVHDLASAVAQALGDGASGVVVGHRLEAADQVAWALDLMHTADAPLVVAATEADVADALTVAAGAPAGFGCLLVARGEIHAARHVGADFTSPGAGPAGHVRGGSVRLLWRPPERITVPGPYGARSPRVGLYVPSLGDDGELLRVIAERCDGLVLTGPVPDMVLSEVAARIPVMSAFPNDGPSPTTALDPVKARILMHVLLAAGRDRDAVLAAFAGR
jgi:L-asparaginase